MNAQEKALKTRYERVLLQFNNLIKRGPAIVADRGYVFAVLSLMQEITAQIVNSEHSQATWFRS